MQRALNLEQESTFEKVLSCINSELKSVTAAFCLDESWKSKTDLKKSFLGLVEDSDVYVPDQSSFGEYCHWSFLKFGFVEEAPVKRGSRFSKCWKLNENGVKLLQPSAALSIRTANEFKTSLYEILGQTKSNGKSRSAYNRAKILMYLDNVEEAGVPELSEFLELRSNAVIAHCRALSNIDFIDFSTQNPYERGWAKYKWVKEKKAKDVKPIEGHRNLTGLLFRVAEFMERHAGGWSSYDIANDKEIKYNHPSNINAILSLGLERQGFAKRLSRFNKVEEKLSEASKREKGKEHVSELLNPIYFASHPNVSEDYLANIRSVFDSYMKCPELRKEHVTCAVNLYEEVAPNLKAEPRKVRESQIINLLKKARKRPVDIDREIGVGSKKYLRQLLSNGTIQRKEEGRAVFYSLPKVE